jgi:hypothetical protein
MSAGSLALPTPAAAARATANLQQVGGALELAILSSVATPRTADALQPGSPLPGALTHGFKGGFVTAASVCALALIVAAAG